MISEFFENGVSNKMTADEYAVIRTPDGLMMVPTFMRTEQKIKMSYEELRKRIEEDIFITDADKAFDKVLKELNKLILKETGVSRRILLSFENELFGFVEHEFLGTIINNKLINDQFDSE